MNAMQILAAQPWVERLGMTLLHSLWQGALIAACYAAVRQWGARALTPERRYVLACAALTLMAVAPLVTWMLLRGPSPQSIAVTFAAPLSAVRTEPARFRPLSLPAEATGSAPAAFLAWVVAFWLSGATAFSVRLFGRWMLAERLRSHLVHPASAEWQRSLDRLKARIAVSRPVRLLVSGLVQAPAAAGWLRPIVLVPAGCLAGMPAAEMEALLLHELAHIRRHDYLVHILQSAAEALFFYHPAVWWISGHMRVERELCCDDIAVSVTGDAIIYARALAEFDSARWLQPAVMAASGGSLSSRIARLLGEPPRSHRASWGPGIAPALLLPAIGAWALFAQPAIKPQFEVASVKPSLSRSVQNVRPLPGRLTADATLQVLIQYAYAVQPYQIVSSRDLTAEAWMQSDRYQIEATADGNVSRDQMFLMLQSLLENRFRLKVHREMRDLPVYFLVAAKTGLRLPPATEDSCVHAAADAPAEWAGGRMAAPGEVPSRKALCGSAILSLGPSGARLQGGNIGMPEVARRLSLILDRSVLDKTGHAEPFDLQLDFIPDENTPAVPPPPPGSDISGPSIAQALRQQLGLQLESKKGPVEVIVIDEAERPAAN